MPCSVCLGVFRSSPVLLIVAGSSRELTRVQWSQAARPMAGGRKWPLDSAGPVDNASAVSARHQAGVREARPTSSGMPRAWSPSGRPGRSAWSRRLRRGDIRHPGARVS